MVDKRRVLYTAEVIGALLYCGFILRLILKDDPAAYAKVMYTFSRGCQFVAGRIGRLGIVAELEYAKLVEMGRMN